MAISLPNTVTAIALLLSSLNATAFKCQTFDSQFLISNWSTEVPHQIDVRTYDKNGKFDHEINQPIKYIGTLADGAIDQKVLLIQPIDKDLQLLNINYDYKIVIDYKTTYNITKIKSSDRANLGCPLSFAEINSCTFTGNGPVSFDKDCIQ